MLPSPSRSTLFPYTTLFRSQDQQPIRGTVQGDDFPAALEAVPWSGEKELSLTSVSYLVVGEDVALEDVLRSEEHTSELQSRFDIVCRLLLEKKQYTLRRYLQ